MLLNCTSHVRGELKTKMCLLTSSFYGFWASNSMQVMQQNRNQAESLKANSAFIFKDWSSKKGIYKTELLQEGINLMWFSNRNDEGLIYHKYFNPFPVRALALVLTAIECCIDKWLQGIKEDTKSTSTTYGPVYNSHLGSLLRFDERTAPYKLLERICTNLHDIGVESLGLSSASTTSQVHTENKAFEDAIREYQLEEQDDAGAHSKSGGLIDADEEEEDLEACSESGMFTGADEEED
ncbi:uncharacterized protein BJ212DRAFT_1378814 [Suillus subaureus]|uniref:DUF6532 domain-containing protein n=1 Tax=Suillus subaureus TaxID=48587 RepID=A0A9P7J9E0_9AGAM|nr:uncharacterized protein BJ212DRAFT_1378814 [Suillus subaureus]KAG1809660.1 hypothetical protein BJ212DRAFT_1378814 [Suillus subaureus]